MHAVKIQGAFPQKAGVAFDLMTEHGVLRRAGTALSARKAALPLQIESSLSENWASGWYGRGRRAFNPASVLPDKRHTVWRRFLAGSSCLQQRRTRALWSSVPQIGIGRLFMMGLNCSATREPGRPMDGAMLSRRFRNPEIGNVDEIVRELAEIRIGTETPLAA